MDRLLLVGALHDQSVAHRGLTILDRPIQSGALGFLIAGLGLIGLHVVLPGLFNAGIRKHDEVDVQLEDVYLARGHRASTPDLSGEVDSLSPRAQRLLFCLSVVAVSARVEIFRLILGYRQCTIPGVEVSSLGRGAYITSTYPLQGLLPFLVAIREYRSLYGSNGRNGKSQRPEQNGSLFGRLINGPLACVGPAALLAVAIILVSIVGASPSSTYICPTASGGRQWTILLQFVGLFLDCVVLISVKDLLTRRRNGASPRTDKAAVILGSILIVRCSKQSRLSFQINAP